jgi:hypothetical protein
VSPVKYELGFYIPEDDILHSYRHEDLESYMLQIPSLSRKNERTIGLNRSLRHESKYGDIKEPKCAALCIMATYASACMTK